MMDVKTFTIRDFYPRTITIDAADGEPTELPIRVRRFTIEQLQEFRAGWWLVSQPASNRYIYRQADGEEQLKRADERTFIIGDAEIERRRIAEMSSETKAIFDDLRKQEAEFGVDFCR